MDNGKTPPPHVQKRIVRYLTILSQTGWDMGLHGRCSQIAGMPKASTVQQWRKKYDGFLETENEVIAKAVAEHEQEKRDLEVPPNVNVYGLKQVQIKFLSEYDRTKDRVEACRVAGCTVLDLRQWQEQSDPFKREWARVEMEIKMSLADAIQRKGMKGEIGAAKAALAATDPSWGNKLRVDHHHQGSITLKPGEAAKERPKSIAWLADRQRALPAGESDA